MATTKREAFSRALRLIQLPLRSTRSTRAFEIHARQAADYELPLIYAAFVQNTCSDARLVLHYGIPNTSPHYTKILGHIDEYETAACSLLDKPTNLEVWRTAVTGMNFVAHAHVEIQLWRGTLTTYDEHVASGHGENTRRLQSAVDLGDEPPGDETRALILWQLGQHAALLPRYVRQLASRIAPHLAPGNVTPLPVFPSEQRVETLRRSAGASDPGPSQPS